MSVWERILDLFGRRKNDTSLEPDDPCLKLEAFLKDSRYNLAKLEIAVGKATEEEMHLEKNFESLKFQEKEWESRAGMALKSGNNNLAQDAARKKIGLENEIKIVHEKLMAIKAQTQTYKKQYEESKARIQEVVRESNLKIARFEVAKAENVITRSLVSRHEGELGAAMASLEREIFSLETRSATALELSGYKLVESSIEAEIAEVDERRRSEEVLKKLSANAK